MISIILLQTLGSAMSDKELLQDATPKLSKKFMELSKFIGRSDIIQGQRAVANSMHTVVFARKQNNIERLKDILMEVSDPRSSKYGKHMSKSDIAALTASPESTAYITTFLATQQISILKSTIYDDYITAEAPVSQWEALFNTEFYEFEQTASKGAKFLRCLAYSLPATLAGHVDTVFNTVQMPDRHAGKRLHHELKDASGAKKRTLIDGTVTPALLNSFYNIGSNTGSQATSQAIYASLDQTLSPSDLSFFQSNFNLPQEAIAAEVGGRVADDACVPDVNNCIEANLDVQYIMAVAQNVPTTYYYWTGADPWLDWITTVADMADPPHVFSISYGSPEAQFQNSYLASFDTEAIKLGVAGVTVLAASGDDGVGGAFYACGYNPYFPASSPYVTSVGATLGPESGNAEVTCQSDQGSAITTGGGFSEYYSQPSWQAEAVTGYFNTVLGTSSSPAEYSSNSFTTKRGYPDISALGNIYQIVANENIIGVSGTSASCPVVAGMVALVNSARLDAGNSTVGWLNPALYQLYPSFAKDVTSGDNRCRTSGLTCCTEGFFAAAGWDPATGLGTINFENFKAVMLDASAVTTFDDDFNANGGGSSDNNNSGLSRTSIIIIAVVVGVVGFFVLLAIVECLCGCLRRICCGGGSQPAHGRV